MTTDTVQVDPAELRQLTERIGQLERQRAEAESAEGASFGLLTVQDTAIHDVPGGGAAVVVRLLSDKPLETAFRAAFERATSRFTDACIDVAVAFAKGQTFARWRSFVAKLAETEVAARGKTDAAQQALGAAQQALAAGTDPSKAEADYRDHTAARVVLENRLAPLRGLLRNARLRAFNELCHELAQVRQRLLTEAEVERRRLSVLALQPLTPVSYLAFVTAASTEARMKDMNPEFTTHYLTAALDQEAREGKARDLPAGLAELIRNE